MMARMKLVLGTAIVLGGLVNSTWAQLGSPGFEVGPDVVVISFSPTDANGLRWFASNADGERIRSLKGRLAAEGNFYAAMFQNAGFYDGAPLGIGDFGFTGFDRIYATFNVDPLTEYSVSFQHAADDRFGYVGDTSVVEIVDAGSNTTITQEMFATPGFFAWQAESFTFTTGPDTTEAAIAFTVMGTGNTSGLLDDVRIVQEPCPFLLTLDGARNRRRNLGALYELRDDVLAASAQGRQYIDLFYRHAAEMSLILLRDRALRVDVRTMTDRFVPDLELALDGAEVILSNADLREIEKVLSKMERHARPELRQDLQDLQVDLRKGYLTDLVGIQVESRGVRRR